MTSIYFVRHALPEHNWKDDRTRPLTVEGLTDSLKVTNTLKDIPFDYCVSSPYIRSIETIRDCASSHGLKIEIEERFHERLRGQGGGNRLELLNRRWEDCNFHEEGGESLAMVQRRNIEALTEVLNACPEGNILFGTHGTALSTILRYYDPSFGMESFLRIVNYMPYIIRLDFEGLACIGKEELLIVDKGITVYNSAYKN